MSNKGILLLIIFAFILFVVSFYSLMILDPGVKPGPKKDTEVSEVPIGGSFNLIDHDGNTITDKSLVGKYSIVYFGFSHCPDICPVALRKISKSLSSLSEKNLDKIQAYFVSLDPDRDTKELLKAFIRGYHSKIKALTGDKRSVGKAADSYKVYHVKNEQSDPNNYLIDHSSLIYLMGPNGKYVKHFSVDISPNELTDELKKTLD